VTFLHEAAAIAVGIAAYDVLKGLVGWLLFNAPVRRRFSRGWWES